MTRRDVVVLRAAAIFTVWVWGTRIWNLWGDDARAFGFKAVHTVIAVVSVAFAVAIWRVASRGKRRREVGDHDAGTFQRSTTGVSRS